MGRSASHANLCSRRHGGVCEGCVGSVMLSSLTALGKLFDLEDASASRFCFHSTRTPDQLDLDPLHFSRTPRKANKQG